MKPGPADRPPTRQRLLAAAARVFAREGLSAATTRGIAREAGVNEVTLFRHFATKDGLIAAVIGANFGGAGAARPARIPPATADFAADLRAYARRYERVLTANLPLVRTLIGEVQHTRHVSHEHEVFRAVFLPLKAGLRARIEAAQRAGALAARRRADVLADLFFAMVFTGVLRRSSPGVALGYPAAAYREAAIALFLDGARAAARRP